MITAAMQEVSLAAVTEHAIQRRLESEMATPEEIDMVLCHGRELAEDIVRDEFAHALEMTPEARRIFIHPGREATLGLIKPATYIDRSGKSVQSLRHRLNESRYYWTGDVIYVVDHGTVVTCIIADAVQVESLFRVQPETLNVNRPRKSIVRAAFPAGCTCVPISQVFVRTPAKREPVKSIGPKFLRPMFFRREPPLTAKWLKKAGATWMVLVADDVDSAPDLVRRTMARIRQEAENACLTVQIEVAECRALRAMREKLKHSKFAKIKELPDMPATDWRKYQAEIPNVVRKWWVEMLEIGQTQGRLLCVVTPETARSILEIAAGSSDAAWRKDDASCDPGQLLTISCMSDKIMVERNQF